MDELLCEYVDGTMDPAVCRVFEEYLEENPSLAAHVQSLKRTRALLCTYRCQVSAPGNFQVRLDRELTTEMMRAMEPLFGEASDRLRHATTATSLALAVALLALFVGSHTLTEVTESTSPTGRADTEEAMHNVPAMPLEGQRNIFTSGTDVYQPLPGRTFDGSFAMPSAAFDFHAAQWVSQP